MNAPRCRACGWRLYFLVKPSRFVAFCVNPGCKTFEVTP